MTGITTPARRAPAPRSHTGGWNPTQRDILHAIFIAVNVLAFALVQIEVPDPYLVSALSTEMLGADFQDEIFHIPQTQRYCDEDFESWDPAITTPPGLYVCLTPYLRSRR